jgi:chromosome segregation ATPase
MSWTLIANKENLLYEAKKDALVTLFEQLTQQVGGVEPLLAKAQNGSNAYLLAESLGDFIRTYAWDRVNPLEKELAKTKDDLNFMKLKVESLELFINANNLHDLRRTITEKEAEIENAGKEIKNIERSIEQMRLEVLEAGIREMDYQNTIRELNEIIAEQHTKLKVVYGNEK